MAVHPLADVTTQVGFEGTPGTPGNATFAFPNLQLNFDDDSPDADVFTSSTFRFPTDVQVGREVMGGSYEGPVAVDEMAFILASLVAYQAPTWHTNDNQFATWTAEPQIQGTDTYKTYTVVQGDSTAHTKYNLMHFLSGAFSVTPDEARVSGNLRARFDSFGTTLPQGIATIPITAGGTGYVTEPTVSLTGGTGSGFEGKVVVVGGVVTEIIITDPGAYTVAPTGATIANGGGSGATCGTPTLGAAMVRSSVLPKVNWDIFYADTWADLASESDKLLTGWAFNFEIGDKFGLYTPINSAVTTFGGIAPVKPPLTLGLSTAFDVATTDLAEPLTRAKKAAGTPIFFRLKGTGKLISGTDYEKFTLDVAAKIMKMPSNEDLDSVLMGRRWALQPFIDPVSKKCFKFGLVNRTGAIA